MTGKLIKWPLVSLFMPEGLCENTPHVAQYDPKIDVSVFSLLFQTQPTSLKSIYSQQQVDDTSKKSSKS